MIGVEVTVVLGYPDGMDVPALQVAMAQLERAVEAFEDVQLMCASVRLIEEG